MISAELNKSETVEDIFRSMDLGMELVNVDFVKKWLNEFMPGGESSNIIQSFPSEEEFQVMPILTDTYGKLTKIKKLVTLLEERRIDLISMLVYLKFTWNNSNLIVKSLLDSFTAYEVEFQMNPCAFNNIESFVFVGSKKDCAVDVLQCISFIARIFFAEGTVYVSASNDLLPFYILFLQICKEFKLLCSYYLEPAPGVTSIDSFQVLVITSKKNLRKETDFFNKTTVKNWIKGSEIPKEYKNSFCPMVIMKDADINAAVDNVCKSICQSPIHVTSSVSHILVEESVFSQTVLLLKDCLRRIKHGNRLDKRTEIELSNIEAKANPKSCSNLEIFSPCEKSLIKLCIGWNPNDIDDSKNFPKSDGFIPVIPFRNIAELKTLIKETFTELCPASIWSENIAVQKISSEFEFSTLWINCHGLYDPLVPHNKSSSSSLLKDNPLLQTIHNERESTISSDIEFQYSVVVKNVLESAKKGYVDWQKCKIDPVVTLINFLRTSISQSDGFCLSCRCGIMGQEIKNRIKLFADKKIGGLTSTTQVTSSRKPIGIIIISCEFASSQFSSLYLKRFVTCALINGNVVIIAPKDDSTTACCEKTLLDFKTLPRGVLNILKPDCLLYLADEIKKDSSLNVFFFELNSCNKIVYCTDNCNLSLVDLNNKFCDEVILNLTSSSRFVLIS